MPAPAEPFCLFKWLMGELPDVEVWIHLYKAFTPSEAIVSIGNFAESTFPGYQPQKFEQAGDRTAVAGRSVTVRGRLVPFTRSGHDAGEETVEGHYEVAVFPDGSKELVVFKPFETPPVMGVESAAIGLAVSLTANRFVVGGLP